MNEQTISRDRLAEEIDALLAPYPDPMSRNDFRIACRIGTHGSWYRKRGCWTTWFRTIITRSRGRVGNIMG